jgi:DNA-binding GntR family transcriptional regulator
MKHGAARSTDAPYALRIATKCGEALGNGAAQHQHARVASDRAAEMVRQAIRDGRIAPGQRLTEERLASDFGMSRTPVREGLKALQAEGLVEFCANRSLVVRTYSRDELNSQYRIRALLEAHAARRAAARIDKEHMAKLHASCDRSEALPANVDVREIRHEDAIFHEVIWRTAADSVLTRMVRQIVDVTFLYGTTMRCTQAQISTFQAQHRTIAYALEQSDGLLAERAMSEHVLYAGHVMLIELHNAQTFP